MYESAVTVLWCLKAPLLRGGICIEIALSCCAVSGRGKEWWSLRLVTQKWEWRWNRGVYITTLKTRWYWTIMWPTTPIHHYSHGSKLNLDFLALSQDRIKPTHASIHPLHFLRRQRSRAQTDNLPVGTNIKARVDFRMPNSQHLAHTVNTEGWLFRLKIQSTGDE